jgi:hypothetical protein
VILSHRNSGARYKSELFFHVRGTRVIHINQNVQPLMGNHRSIMKMKDKKNNESQSQVNNLGHYYDPPFTEPGFHTESKCFVIVFLLFRESKSRFRFLLKMKNIEGQLSSLSPSKFKERIEKFRLELDLRFAEN